jgi:hypothetical protein
MANKLETQKKHVNNAIAVTPNDSTDLAETALGLYVGGEGDLRVMLSDATTAVTFVGVSGGLPLMVKRVYATGTTATDILALY